MGILTEAFGPVAAGGRSAGRRIWLERLMLTDFRSYAHAEIVCDGRPVVLSGPNGAGKTNLIEAISFLAPGRGLRRARLGEIDRRAGASVGSDRPWAVAARLNAPEGPVEIGTGRASDSLPGGGTAAPGEAREAGEARENRETSSMPARRIVKIDGVQVRAQEHLAARLALVWLTPQMDRLFLEGPGGRRRFLDRLVLALDPSHGGRVAALEHAARERSKILADAWAQNRSPDSGWLEAIEEQIAGLAVALGAARADLVARLAEMSRRAGAFPKPALRLSGPIAEWLAAMPALAVEERVRMELARSRGVSAAHAAGQSGVLRDDLEVALASTGHPAASASTGEQKALLIAIVLAHARLIDSIRGAAPILLLDEIAAHLDAGRRRALFEAILALGVQAWMTGTDAAIFDELGREAQRFSVRDATIAPS